MAADLERTPDRPPEPVGPVDFAVAVLAAALRETLDALAVFAERRRKRTGPENDVALIQLAKLLRNLKHLGADGEDTLQRLVGYTSDREVRVTPKSHASDGLRRARVIKIVAGSLAALAAAVAAVLQALRK